MTRSDRPPRGGWPIAWAALVLPLLVWAVVLLAGGWVPHGDTAVEAVRAHDVLGAHTPLLGMPSTSGATVVGVHAHHPGPLQFQLLAPLYALSGFAPWALVVGSLLILAALVAVSLAAADRAAGARGRQTMTVVNGVLVLGVGSSLVTPWNPWVAMFALAAATASAWAVLAGHGRWWPGFVVTVSLAAQSHLAVAPVAVSLGVVTLVASVLLGRRGRLDLPRRSLVVSVALGMACWAAPLVEVARNEPDNLGLLWTVARSGDGGLLATLVLLVGVVAVVWWTGRRGRGLPSGRPFAIVPLTLIGTLVLLAAGTRAGEGRDWYIVYGAAVPLTLVAWTVVGRVRRSRHRRTLGRVAVAVAVAAFLFLPRPLSDAARLDSVRAAPVVDRARELVAGADGPIAIETVGGLAWVSIGPAVYAALLADGHEVYFDARVDGMREDDFRHPRNLDEPHRTLVVHSHPGRPEPPPEGAVVDRVELARDAGATQVAGDERYVDLVLVQP